MFITTLPPEFLKCYLIETKEAYKGFKTKSILINITTIKTLNYYRMYNAELYLRMLKLNLQYF